MFCIVAFFGVILLIGGFQRLVHVIVGSQIMSSLQFFGFVCSFDEVVAIPQHHEDSLVSFLDEALVPLWLQPGAHHFVCGSELVSRF